MKLEWVIALRYMRARKRNRFISFVTIISIVGIGLGVGVIITVLSIMNGFKEELRTRLLNYASHGTVMATSGSIDSREVMDILKKNKKIIGTAPFIETHAMMIDRGVSRGVYVRGVTPVLEKEVFDLEELMLWGSSFSLTSGSYHILLGDELARSLGAGLGDKVTVIVPDIQVGITGFMPRFRRFKVTGIFSYGLSNYDRSLAFVDLKDAALLLKMKEKVSGVRLRFDDLFQAPEIGNQVERDLGGGYWVSDWTQQNSNFFRAIEMEKLMLLIVMTLIVAIASFNIVSMLVMLVNEKRAEIAILQTMGLIPTKVVRVFVLQGSMVGLSGTLFGAAGGSALAFYLEELVQAIEGLTGFKFLSPDVYPITEVPSQLLFSDVTMVCLISLFLTGLATLYPAFRATRVRPAEALKYE